MKKFTISLTILLLIIIGGALYWLNKDNTASIITDEKTTISTTQIESIEAIGQ